MLDFTFTYALLALHMVSIPYENTMRNTMRNTPKKGAL